MRMRVQDKEQPHSQQMNKAYLVQSSSILYFLSAAGRTVQQLSSSLTFTFDLALPDLARDKSPREACLRSLVVSFKLLESLVSSLSSSLSVSDMFEEAEVDEVFGGAELGAEVVAGETVIVFGEISSSESGDLSKSSRCLEGFEELSDFKHISSS